VIAVAVARYCTGLGLVDYQPDEAGGNAFIVAMPEAPDLAAVFSPYGGADFSGAATFGYDEPRVQVMTRSAAGVPQLGYALAVQIYDVLQGLEYTVMDPGGDAEADVVYCKALQTAPVLIGLDDNGRARWTLNYSLHVKVAASTNRET